MQIAQALTAIVTLPDRILGFISNFVSGKIFEFINFGLQSIFFSFSVINMLSSLVLMLGLTHAITIINRKIIYIGASVLFMLLHFETFGDNYQYTHEMLTFISGFYLCTYVIQGCAYTKQRLQNPSHQSPSPNNPNTPKITTQLSLIFITLFSSLFFIFIWYNIKVSKSLPYLKDNYTILAVFVISTLVMYGVSIFRRVSLFLPALVCMVGYGVVGVRIWVDLVLYEGSVELSKLCLPFQSIIVLMLSLQGKQKHLTQSLSTLKTHLTKSYDNDHLHQLLKNQRLLTNNLYWSSVFYYLYTLTHGGHVHIEYMMTPVFLWHVMRGYVK